MRMWLVPPERMCRKHLLGEHVEMHMFAGSLRKGKSMQGYIDKGLVYFPLLKSRHDDLATEMVKRGMNHESELRMDPKLRAAVHSQPKHWFPFNEARAELFRRCPECAQMLSLLK